MQKTALRAVFLIVFEGFPVRKNRYEFPKVARLMFGLAFLRSPIRSGQLMVIAADSRSSSFPSTPFPFFTPHSVYRNRFPLLLVGVFVKKMLF
jgi:hypothetical protein